MRLLSPPMGWALGLLCVVTAPVAGQVDERPREALPPTREELARQQAEEPRRKAETLFGLGVLLASDDRLLEATRTLEEAIRLDPKALAPRRALVPLYLAFEREDDALALSREIVAADPGDYEMWLLLSRKHKSARRLVEASETLERALASKRLNEQPDRLLMLLEEQSQLYEQQSKLDDVERIQRRIVAVVTQHQGRLLDERKLTEDGLLESLAKTHEAIGRLSVANQRLENAGIAFREAQTIYQRLAAKKGPGAQSAAAARLEGNLAEVYFAQQNLDAALQSLNRYLESAPASIDPYERKVTILKTLGRTSDVVTELRRHVQADANHLGLRLLLARELSLQNTPAGRNEAEQVYLQLNRTHVHPQVVQGLFDLYARQQRMDMVLQKLDDVWKITENKDTPNDEKTEAIARAKVMLDVLRQNRSLVAGLLVAARNDLNRRTPRTFDTWRVLAMLAARTRQLDFAELLYRQAMDMAKANPAMEPDILDGLIRVLQQARKYQAVVQLCRERLGGDAGFSQVVLQYHLALALSNLDQFDEAIREIDRAIQLASDSARLSVRIRKIHILRRAQRFETAVFECLKMLEESTNPGHTREIRYVLSHTYGSMNDHAKAEAELRKILELDPNDASANNDLGYQLADQGRNLDEAERMIRKAIDLDRAQRKNAAELEPENAAYLDSLGWVLFRQGKWDEARKWLEQATTLPEGEEDPTVWDHLGDVLARMQQPLPAREAWEKAKERYERDRRLYPAERLEEVNRKLRQGDLRTVPATPVKRDR
ncbi:tetratricopeptide repeat protein [Tuwongella immobilis]|uniref:Tetratricopeptide repeat protein n=1 Tax=Tuwongella immobilis TaxID=692036 RepID=A0A6C2YWS5_9BACT|nr:tetratricopeptide repeat protein [Tuwongella immobilis]VIP05285.1 tetratricopeptide repeat protein : Tetratricopeptide repeat protein OS=Planctomyces maris DSM 8797 GN=PM8797T_17744 PE=4 SV=1: TPR_2: TPR_1: TPR_2: TPR_11: TPR_11 [Tuwongella immobilis]VTS07926.1 tetratricopeptide repeat protein : Tetratricopeptide repeat protein OS=Planctomyces maris DSM 8797 GN=PM8797T_17744 PE=4 SV=1: TPR_2: TPR_1: TPR_2: TPR_11: TPR_11 [Tuwongella immobilis]